MFMQKLRKQTKYFLWVVVLGFVLWIAFDLGGSLGLKKVKPWQKGIVAKVDGKEIPYRVFEAQYQEVLQDTLKNIGERTLSYEEENKIKDDVWQNMLSEIRYRELMKKRKIRFNDDVYLALMQSIPPQEILKDTTFRDSTGQFDFKKYRQALGNPRNANYFINYEYRLRGEIIPREINAIDIYYALDMTDAEFQKFLALDTEIRKCKYFLIKPFDVPDSLVHYTEDEVKHYYNLHQEDFKVPRQYSLLVVRFPIKPSSSDTINAKERLEDVLFSLSQGDTFELLAKEMSDDPSGKNGGDIGWIKDSGKYAFLYSILKKAPIDTVIGPFKNDGAFYIAKKVEEKKDSMHVKIIKSNIKVEDQTVYDLRNDASNFAEEARNADFQEVAKENGYRVIKTGYFKENAAFARGLGLLRGRIKALIKKGKKGDIVGPIKVSGGFVVFEVEDIKEPYTPPYDSVKMFVEKQVKWQKKLKKAEELAKNARSVVINKPDSSQLWDSAKVVVKPARATVAESRPFSITGFVDYNVGNNIKFKTVAFSLKNKELSDVYSDDRIGAFFIYLENITENKNIYPFVVNMKKSNLFNSLFEQNLMKELAGTTNVKDYREYFLAK